MNYIVLVSGYGLKSMKETISKMNIPVTILVKKNDWMSFESGKIGKKVSEPKFNSTDIVIKWGNSISLSGNPVTYNKPGSVSKSSDKGLFRQIMMENEIPIPNPYHKDSNRWPIILRPLHHHAGQHFHVANNISEMKVIKAKLGECYASEVYPKQREVRVHCASGKVLLIKEKPAPEDKSILAWNFAINEEAWSTIDRKDYDPDLCKLALDAMKAIDLDIGAVDIMFDPISKDYAKHVVCEINTAPSLTEYLQLKYAMYFDHVFSQPNKIESWDYSKFKEGKSFSWKNEQLLRTLS